MKSTPTLKASCEQVLNSPKNTVENTLEKNQPSYLAPGFYACLQKPISAEPLVLLHGWGCDSQSWQGFGVKLRDYFDVYIIDLPGFGENKHLAINIESLLSVLPKVGIYLGWSLGGMLAMQIAHLYPQRVSAVITLAANARFTQSDQWPNAMDELVYQNFANSVQQNAQKTLKQFAQLVAGNPNSENTNTSKTLLKQLRDLYSQQLEVNNLSKTLDWLHSIDNQKNYASIIVPGLHLLAEGDQLVPKTCIADLEDLSKAAPCEQKYVSLNSSHALHLEIPEELVKLIVDFVQEHQPHRNKYLVAESFGRCAEKYDDVADFQRQVGAELLHQYRQYINQNSLQETELNVLDLGSGTGFFSNQLSNSYHHIAGVDISHGMASFAQHHYRKPLFSVGDAESLPFLNNSFDALYSSLSVQWCEQPAKLLSEINRILKPEARAFISTLGPQSLLELKAAWKSVDDYRHVNRFLADQVLVDIAKKLQLKDFSIHTEIITLYFSEFGELIKSIRDIGAHNVNQNRAGGLGGKQRLLRLKESYEQFRVDQGLPLTYEVYYLSFSG